ncbi:MAL protein, partial [Galbula dea]|nr:MAL protein [Galbula dea]
LTMSSATSTASLPSGLNVLTTFPDVLFIPEIIFGGLVWILVASSRVQLPMLQGWVMFVSVFCFITSTTLLCLYICGVHGGSSSWITLVSGCDNCLLCCCCTPESLYHINQAIKVADGVFFPLQVFAFVATLLYVIHKVGSLLRWKSS